MGMEKRQFERRRVHFQMVYDDGSSFNAGIVRDVSEGGVFLETALPLPVGSLVTITAVDGAGKDLGDVVAKVARSIPYDPDGSMLEGTAGMGLEFQNLDDAARERIVGIIRAIEDEHRRIRSETEFDPFLGVRVRPMRREHTPIPPPPKPTSSE